MPPIFFGKLRLNTKKIKLQSMPAMAEVKMKERGSNSGMVAKPVKRSYIWTTPATIAESVTPAARKGAGESERSVRIQRKCFLS
jgi:hypothetical protein